MKIVELEPLVRAAARLAGNVDTRDISEEIAARAERAASPSMAQSLCSHVIEMCHPKAWGDRSVTGLDGIAWCGELASLAAVAEDCGQAIYEAYRPAGGA